MRCPTCDMEIALGQSVGLCCVHCVNICTKDHIAAVKVSKPKISKVKAPAPAPAPAPAIVEPEPELEPEEGHIRTITDLRVMLKGELVELAAELELDSEGTKEDLVERIADELGIEY